MSRRVRVIGKRKEKPDYRLYALALIALARQLQEDEERRAEADRGTAARPSGTEEASNG